MFNEGIISTPRSKAHWQVAKAHTQPKPAKELSSPPNTLSDGEFYVG